MPSNNLRSHLDRRSCRYSAQVVSSSQLPPTGVAATQLVSGMPSRTSLSRRYFKVVAIRNFSCQPYASKAPHSGLCLVSRRHLLFHQPRTSDVDARSRKHTVHDMRSSDDPGSRWRSRIEAGGAAQSDKKRRITERAPNPRIRRYGRRIPRAPLLVEPALDPRRYCEVPNRRTHP